MALHGVAAIMIISDGGAASGQQNLLAEGTALTSSREDFRRSRHNMHVVSFSLYATLYILPLSFATPENEKIVAAIVTNTVTICPISGTWSGSTRTAYAIVSDTPVSTKTTIESSELERSQWSHRASSPSSQLPSTVLDTVMTTTCWATATAFQILEKNDTSAYLSHEHNSTLATLASHSNGNLSRTDVGSRDLFSGTSGHSRPTSRSTLPVSASSFVSSGVKSLHPWYFVLIMAFAFTL